MLPQQPSHGEGHMPVTIGRREVIAGLGGAAAWPLVGRGQQASAFGASKDRSASWRSRRACSKWVGPSAATCGSTRAGAQAMPRRIPSMKPRTGRSHPVTMDLTVSQSRSGRCITERQIERLMDYARKRSRHGHRDATMILTAYRHGLLATEVCHLQWRQIELSEERLHVRRAKGGIPSVHPI